MIPFDEPALARVPGCPSRSPRSWQEAAALLVDGVVATTILQTYFGEVTLGEALFDLPFDGFGLDLVSGPGNAPLAKAVPAASCCRRGSWTRATPGSRSSTSWSSHASGCWPRTSRLERLWISPSSGLEYLPREAAERKLVRLAEAAKEVRS